MIELSGLSGKTVVITGAGGMLGRAFSEALSDVPNVRVEAKTRQDMDVTDRDRVLALADLDPDIIIHCAATVDAEGCETNPENCRRIQVDGTVNVADLASSTGAQVFYPQSFLIFDGSETPIVETTPPAPMSTYGQCKLNAETALRDRVPDALVVRMAGFFGGDEKDKNFVGKFVPHMFKLIGEGVSEFAVGDRIWQPTYTLDLARNGLVLLAQGKGGIYNMSCHGQASFYELAAACVSELGLDGRMSIIPTTEAAVAGSEKAARPAVGVMENRRMISEGLDRQRPWREALAEYLNRPYFQTMSADRLPENS
ncbi:MAG: NAD(P)-dependent oxidoreductase [Rhodospirillaceae bacterium]|nr:NAD(P)-dependent oxidoreductase [Rhodospirillaceae bacterium]